MLGAKAARGGHLELTASPSPLLDARGTWQVDLETGLMGLLMAR